MPDLGDTATATLTVDPFDGTTSATLQLFAPDGTETAPSASTADGGATWTATVVYDQTGWWLLTWTVTGTGAGVEHQRVFIPQSPAAGVAPAYTTLELVKASLHEPAGRDDLLLEKIQAASRSIDQHTGRRFWLDTTAVARTINPGGRVRASRDGEHLLIDDIGDLDGLLVEVGSNGSFSDVTSEVEAEPTDAAAKGQPTTALLRTHWLAGTSSRVRITSRWGWPVVPDVVREATLIQAIRLFKRKDSAEGVLGSAEWGTVRLSRIDPDVQSLIQHLVKPGIG